MALNTHEIDIGRWGPLELDWMLRFLGDRGIDGVEHLDDNVYKRSVPLANGDAILTLSLDPDRPAAFAVVEDERDAPAAAARIHRMLDLDADVMAIAAALTAEDKIRPLVQLKPGLRVPGSADPNELAFRAVIGQQVSVVGARTLAGRLVAAYGRPLSLPDPDLTHTFPRPIDLADASLDEVGMPGARKNAIRTLAAALADRAVVLEPSADREELRDRLIALPGIGPWTADYVAMRGLGDPDVFLGSDLGVRKALEKMGLPSKPGDAMRVSERWRPWRSYAVQYLWWSLG